MRVSAQDAASPLEAAWQRSSTAGACLPAAAPAELAACVRVCRRRRRGSACCDACQPARDVSKRGARIGGACAGLPHGCPSGHSLQLLGRSRRQGRCPHAHGCRGARCAEAAAALQSVVAGPGLPTGLGQRGNCNMLLGACRREMVISAEPKAGHAQLQRLLDMGDGRSASGPNAAQVAQTRLPWAAALRDQDRTRCCDSGGHDAHLAAPGARYGSPGWPAVAAAWHQPQQRWRPARAALRPPPQGVPRSRCPAAACCPRPPAQQLRAACWPASAGSLVAAQLCSGLGQRPVGRNASRPQQVLKEEGWGQSCLSQPESAWSAYAGTKLSASSSRAARQPDHGQARHAQQQITWQAQFLRRQLPAPGWPQDVEREQRWWRWRAMRCSALQRRLWRTPC